MKKWSLAVYRADKYIRSGRKNETCRERAKSILSMEYLKYESWLREHMQALSPERATTTTTTNLLLEDITPLQLAPAYKDAEKLYEAEYLDNWKKVKKNRPQWQIDHAKTWKALVNSIVETSIARGDKRESTMLLAHTMETIAPVMAFTAIRYLETSFGKRLRFQLLNKEDEGWSLVTVANIAIMDLYNANLIYSAHDIWKYAFFVYQRLNAEIWRLRSVNSHEQEFNSDIKYSQIERARKVEASKKAKIEAITKDNYKILEQTFSLIRPYIKRGDVEKLEKVFIYTGLNYNHETIASYLGIHHKTVFKYVGMLESAYKAMIRAKATKEA